MHPATEDKRKRLRELNQEARTCSDPYHLISELVYDNERLRQQVRKLTNQCDK